jgi:hypothetical protein
MTGTTTLKSESAQELPNESKFVYYRLSFFVYQLSISRDAKRQKKTDENNLALSSTEEDTILD